MPLPRLPPPLALHHAAIDALLRPVVLLCREGRGAPAARLGGAPRVAPGTEWPMVDGAPMTFVLEVDCAAVARQAGAVSPDLPDDGVLALFADLDAARESPDPLDPRTFRLVFSPRSAEAAPLAVPEAVRARSRRHADGLSLRAFAAASLPDVSELEALVGRELRDDELDAFYDLCDALRPADEPVECAGHLLGHAEWVDGSAEDAIALADAWLRGLSGDEATAEALLPDEGRLSSAWPLLLQVVLEEDAGFAPAERDTRTTLYVLAPREDLAARRFDRACAILQEEHVPRETDLGAP